MLDGLAYRILSSFHTSLIEILTDRVHSVDTSGVVHGVVDVA